MKKGEYLILKVLLILTFVFFSLSSLASENHFKTDQHQPKEKTVEGILLERTLFCIPSASDLSVYIANVETIIKGNWSPSRQTRPYVVVTSFKITKDGVIHGIRIKTSSGIKVADKEAILAIRSSSPLPSPPCNKHVKFGPFSFDYNLAKSTAQKHVKSKMVY